MQILANTRSYLIVIIGGLREDIMTTRHFLVQGMHCAGCAYTIESFGQKAGAQHIYANPVTETVSITYDPNSTDISLIINAIESAGYKLQPAEEDSFEKRRRESAFRKEKKKLLIAISFSLPLFCFSMAGDLGLVSLDTHPLVVNLVMLGLATPVQFYCGLDFHRQAIRSVKTMSPNMSLLVSIGSFSAYLYSLFMLLFSKAPGHLFFETSAIIITFVMFGKYLEGKAKIKTSVSIRSLVEIMPNIANVMTRDGEIRSVSPTQVKEGDICVVKPGERVPCDGVIIEGSSMCDESFITGEPIRFYGVGDKVHSGSLVLDGLIKVETTKIATSSTLSQILSLLKNASFTKAPIQNTTDRMLRFFIPFVIVLALVTAIMWLIFSNDIEISIIRMTAVLVAACPCALGLATPTALVAGIGKIAQNGVLFLDTGSVEMAGKIDTLILDKTGTLTEGKPTVKKWIQLDGSDESLLLVGSAETGVNHPIASAIVDYAKRYFPKLIEPQMVQSYSGQGIIATVNGRDVRVGLPKWVWGEDNIEQIYGHEGSVVAVSIEGRKTGLFVISDREREDVEAFIVDIHKLGIKPIIATGDHEFVAKELASHLGIEKVYGRMMPNDKVALIKELKMQGRFVAMIGDGINDAPALSASDLGIAYSNGDQITKNCADATVLFGGLLAVSKAIRIARFVKGIVSQNLFWAVFYNLLLLPIASGLFYHVDSLPHFLRELNPGLAALAMSISSITVVLNSQRINMKS